jgi:ATP phosphoribosyltransferase regulatory subunit
MGKNAVALPYGKTYLPLEAQKKREMESNIAKAFAWGGYSEIVLPLLVNAESGIFESDGVLKDQGVRLFGRSGEMLALRSDFTVPAASLVSSYFSSDDLPLRLYYGGQVFRVDSKTGEIQEFSQAGAELIGAKGVSADTECIMLALRTLKAVGCGDFRIGVGSAALLKGILDYAKASKSDRISITHALSKRNYVDYEGIIAKAGLSPDSARMLRALPGLSGSPDMLDRVARWEIGETGEKAITLLKTLFKEIEAKGFGSNVYVDLGISRTFEYYTGVVFEGYIPKAGRAILGGGRYDSLFSSFGLDVPAAGFGISVDGILETEALR